MKAYLKIWLLLLLLPLCADAKLSLDDYVTSHDIVEQKKQFEIIDSQLQSHGLSYFGIQEKIKELKKVHRFALECSLQRENMITHMDDQKRNLILSNKNIDSYRDFFESKRNHYITDLAECQNLFFRVQNTLEKTDDFLKYAKNYRFKNNRRPTIIDIFGYKDIFSYSLIPRPKEEIFLIELQAEEFRDLIFWTAGGLFFGLLLAWCCRRLGKISNHYDLKYILFKASIYLPFFVPILLVHDYLYEVYIDTLQRPPIIILLLVIIIYLFIRFVLTFYCHIRNKSQNYEWRQKISKLGLIIINIFFISGVLRFFVLNLFEPNPMEQCLVFVYFMFINILILSFWIKLILVLTDVKYFSKKNKAKVHHVRSLLVGLVIFLASLKLIFVFAGYYEFSVNYSLFILVLLFVFFRLCVFLKQADDYLQSGKNQLSKKLYRLLGLSQQKHIYELSFLRYILLFNFAIHLGRICLWVLGLPQFYLINFKDFFYQPQTIGHMQVVIIDFLYASFWFSILMLLGKLLARYIVQSQHLKNQANLGITISILVRYLVFSISLIVCFLILGFNFTQITVLLGGIGLGLGVGLQNLVMDFIAGIIILLQKNIRITDYVTIHDLGKQISGYVQKIMLLSTQIITDDQSILYIPNSSLIKGGVNNHTTYQGIEKCVIPFDFKNFKDYESAKSILLDIVMKQKNIIQTPPENPFLIMDGAYSKTRQRQPEYILHLVFSVKEVGSKQQTCHQLMHNIHKAFKRYGLELENTTDL